MDVAHRLEDGGGRELAYVSMSRARQRSTVHAVADHLDQAVEDLRRDWAQERRPRWAIDTGTPVTDPLAAEHEPAAPTELRQSLRRARLRAERDALAALVPPDPSGRLFDIHLRAGELRQQLDDLERGAGRYQHTELGAAARAHRQAQDRGVLAERVLGDPKLGWWTRRAWRRQLTAARNVEHELRARWDELAESERTPLQHALHQAETDAASLHRQTDQHRRWIRSRPDVMERLDRIDHALGRDDADIETIEAALGISHARARRIREEPEIGLGVEL